MIPLAIDLSVSAEDVGSAVVALFIGTVAVVGVAAWWRS